MLEHISVTQLTMLARCPVQYEWRYVKGEKRPPGIAAVVGGGVHGGAERAMRNKAGTRQNMQPDAVKDLAVAEFETRLAEGVHLTPEEKSVGRLKVFGAARDATAEYAAFWADTAQHEYQPLDVEAVEWKWEIELERFGTLLTGVTDLVDDRERVVDWKTGKRAPPVRDAETSLQLTAYALAYQKMHGSVPSSVLIDAMTRSSSGVRRTVHASLRGRADYQQFLDRVEVALQLVGAGRFMPCNPDSWFCSRRWCGYSDVCKFYIPELDKEVLR
jgi:hypothetical protein